MSVYDPGVQGDCFSKFTHSYPFSHYQEILEICCKAPESRNSHEKKLLVDLLHCIQSVNQTFKVASDYKTYLLQCSDYIEPCSFKRGEPLLLRGDKCNDILVVLEGTVNIYELKSPQEIQKQIDEALNRQVKTKNSLISPNASINKISSQGSLGFLSRRRERGNPSIDLSDEQEKAMYTNAPPPRQGFTTKRKIKIKSIVTFLRSKADSLANAGEDRIVHDFDYLPESEQLLLEDEVCKAKYFKDGACLLYLKDSLGVGDIVNEKSLLADYRSPVTLIAEDDVECFKLNKDVFRDVVKEEIKSLEEKKNFFLDFFQEANQAAVLQILNCIVEKNYKMHEKLYKQGDKSRGMYFVKEGGDVKLYLSTTQQKNQENEEETDALQIELFLPNQQRAQRKETLAIGIISKGDFFGEEGMVFNQQTRKYTAMSSSDHLTLYYISSKQHDFISDKCPQVWTILRERAEHRNNWLENNIKTSEAVKKKTKQLFNITKNSNISISATQTHKKERPGTTRHAAFSPSSEMKSLKKVLVLKEEDAQQMENGHLPHHFVVARKKSSIDPRRRQEIDLALQTWASEKVASKENIKRPVDTKNMDITVMKSMELPPSYRLFDYERSQHKRYTSKVPEEMNRSNNRTMTGLVKDQDLSQTIQNRVLRQANLTPSTPKDIQMTPLSPNVMYRRVPYLGVKSYASPQNESKTPETTKTPPPIKDISSYHLLKSSMGVRPPKANHQGKPLQTSSGSLQTSIDWTKFEIGRSPNSLNTDWLGKNASETQTNKVIFSYRPGGSSIDKIRVDTASFASSTAVTYRKGSRSNIVALKQEKQLTGMDTETNSSLDISGKKGGNSAFKAKMNKLGIFKNK